jgi:hypothetical protein
MEETITIAHRYRGPEQSGNGGYTCGVVGALVDAPAAEVTLRLPPPLERPLRVERDGSALRVLDGDEVVAEARALDSVDLQLPPPVPFADAEGGEPAPDHPFPSCFVCGPGREPGDALRLAPRPVGEGRVAAPWEVTAEQAGRRELVWAALDCPGAYAVDPELERGASVLGRLAAQVCDTPHAGERCVVLGWPLPGAEGRKVYAGTAVYGDDGRLLGKARATWITLSG